jgi:hypothetical protein
MNADMQAVLTICAELEKSNKKPSVGMIKAKSAISLPIPLIIKSLSYWKEHKQSLLEKGIQLPSDKAPAELSQGIFTTEQEKAISTLIENAEGIKELKQECQALRKQVIELQQQLLVSKSQ